MTARVLTGEVRRRFWAAIRQGASTEEATEIAGMSRQQGQTWFRNAGGMPPRLQIEPSPRFLGIEEREEILRGITRGDSIRAIAARIRRPASTVLREVRRNRGKGPAYRARRSGLGRPVTREVDYSPHRAQAATDRRRARPKRTKLELNPRLRVEVEARLRARHSPQQIMRRLRRDWPDLEEMQISHEAIYRSLYVQGRGGLRTELAACLRSGRAVRKPRARTQRQAAAAGQSRFPGMVLISERPAEVEDRAVPGHWEGDLIVGKDGCSQIGTLVERTTRFVILLHLANRQADTVADQMIVQMRRLPDHLRRSLTWDQGAEMAEHARIQAELDMGVYFCDPHSPWQRGSNENTNGLLRQYFPKGTDLSGYTQHYLDYVADQLNSRPRMTLNWDTPAEALDRLLSTPPDHGVALTA